MTVHQKSVLGWLIGAGLGAIAGALVVPNRNSKIKSKLFGSALGALGGASIIGMVNDKRLESDPSYTGR
jgi:uncharacterized membrane protein YfcA